MKKQLFFSGLLPLCLAVVLLAGLAWGLQSASPVLAQNIEDMAPVANDDSGAGFSIDEDTPFVTGDVLANDYDPEGQPLSVQSFDTSETLGLVTFNGGGGAPPGNLDVDVFGAPNGYITITFGGNPDWAKDLALQRDGKLVVAGYTANDGTEADFALARYNPDGSPDIDFGSGGAVTTDFNAGHDIGWAVAVQQDYKIIVAGTAYNDPLYADFALARYNPDGSLDETFGNAGKVLTDFGSDEEIHDIVIQLDGKIVATGYTFNGSGYDLALARYNPDGSLDATFGSGGKVTADFGDNDDSRSIALMSDGKILVAGLSDFIDASEFVVACFNPDGSPDVTFGSNGNVTTSFFGLDEMAGAVAVQADGQIIAAGGAYNGSNYDMVLARYNPDGSPDTTFDVDGKVITDFDGGYDYVSDLIIQIDGKIIGVGGTSDVMTYDYSAVVRYNPDGSLDPAFGEGGRTFSDFGYNQANAVVLQPDGKIVTAGGVILARYLGISNTFTYDPNDQFEYLSASETATDTFTYMVTNGVLTDTATVSITVTGLNDPPQFTSTPVITAVSTIAYTYTITTTDPDAGDVLTITAPILPAWLSLADHGDRTATLSGTPSAPGSFPVLLQVTDGLTNTTQAFTITVSAYPITPTADLSITQSFQWASSSSGVFTLVASNLGPDNAPGAVVSDTFPASFAEIAWTCTASGGASCTLNGAGNLYEALASLPADSTVTYTVTVTDIRLASWTNTALILTPVGVSDPDLTNNRATSEHFQVLLPVIFSQYPLAGPGNPPAALDDSGSAFTTDEDTAFVTGDVLLNDYDPEGKPLSVQNFNTDQLLGQISLTVPAGNLDTTRFGAPNGFVTTDFGTCGFGRAVAVQSDGEIIVAGQANYTDFGLARYNQDGSLDTTFGSAGLVTTDFGHEDGAYALALQPDDKIVALGDTYDNLGYNFALARYNPDGSLDATFGLAGKVTTDFGGFDSASGLAIQLDGKIVAAGYTGHGLSDSDFALVRYNTDGSPDTTFGSNGIVTTDFGGNDGGRDVAIQPDGKIIVGGFTENGYDFAVARYNPDGSLDSTFGLDGKVTTDFGFREISEVITIQTDVKIILAGIGGNSPDDFVLARYNPDGSLDPAFGSGGKVVTDLGGSDYGHSMALQPDGKIILAGQGGDPADFALARYHPNGSLDETFGIHGKVTTLNLTGYPGSIGGIALQNDGKIVAAGSALYQGENVVVVARYLGTGSGTFTYDPNGQFQGLATGETASDTFTYVVTDGVLTDTATVTITITGVDEPPLVDAGPGQSAITLATPGAFDSDLATHRASVRFDQILLPVNTKQSC